MEEGKDRRDRLARLQLERMSRQPDKGWQSGLGQFIDRWSGFTTGAPWEKAFFAGAVLLVAALAIGGLFMLITSVMGGSDGKKDVSAHVARPTATRSSAPPTPTQTAIVIAVPTYPTAEPTPRTDCAAIGGSSYASDAEREFFLSNCTSPTEVPKDTPTPASSHKHSGPPPTSPPPEPTKPPPPPPGFTASDAINAGAYWMSHNGYSNVGSCNAFDTGSHWVVTCSATSASGQTTVSVCVYQDPLAVRPSDQC